MDHPLAGGVTLLHFTFTSHQRRPLTRFGIYCSRLAPRGDARVVKFASRGYYESLLEDGVEIAEYQPTMMHIKAMVVDGVLSVFGSANFDNRSLELNDELNVAVFDGGLAARLLQDFERDLTQSNKLDLDGCGSRPLTEKGRDWLWSYFGEAFLPGSEVF
jgi:phosphatidylserine/phosphatidylglycerophosphate/cardiolipin synthase-like enzyme